MNRTKALEAFSNRRLAQTLVEDHKEHRQGELLTQLQARRQLQRIGGTQGVSLQ